MNDHLLKRSRNYLNEEPEESFRQQIESLMSLNNEESIKELTERLAKNCQFGTAGLRARMEAGYNRMNLVSIFRFSHALATELLSQNENRVVVGFDGRNNSQKFALEAAQVLAKMGIETFLFNDSVPTPITAYATKYLKAHAGVMITASHNPAYDNGVKLFGINSAQFNGQKLKRIEQNMDLAPLRSEFIFDSTKINEVPSAVFESYLKEIKETRLFKDEPIHRLIPFVYTPLHGVGKDIFLKATKEEGFENITVVLEQACPNGDFPTVLYPNPEEENTLDKAHGLALERKIPLVFAHDPDADRLQVSYPLNQKMTKLSGNEMGAILGYFAMLRANEKSLVASSIVSSRMLNTMASHMGVAYVDGLTGFSNIIEKALSSEAQTKAKFIFGYEEAIGFLMGQVILDKDGINAGLRFLEIAGYLSQEKKDVWQFLDELYLKFGVFVSSQWSIRFDGLGAMEKMSEAMLSYRAQKDKISSIFQSSECKFYDLLLKQENNCYAGLLANVLIFETCDLRLIIRPSGTEPKIKIYLEAMDKVADTVLLAQKKAELEQKLIKIKESFKKASNQ